MSLRDIVAAGRIRGYWPLNEPSGPAIDTFRGLDGADITTVGTAGGLIYPTSRLFVASKPDRFEVPNNALLNMPASGRMTLAGWAYVETTPATAYNYWSLWGLPNDLAYSLQYWEGDSGPDRWRVLVGNAAGSDTGVLLQSDLNASIQVWACIIVEIDEISDFVSIEVNRANRAQSNALTWTVVDSASDLWIGCEEPNLNHFDGRLQGWTHSEGLWTDDEKDEFYNGGAGFDLNTLLSDPNANYVTARLLATRRR